MDYQKLANLLFPDMDKSIDYYLTKYPKRTLQKGAEVTRIAPSPTGFLHVGTIYGALIDWFTASQTNGVYYMRLEDTDSKREVANAGQIAYDMLSYYNVKPMEGYAGSNPQTGLYGDYIQSHRTTIYKTFAKHLVSIGRAFPCFCTKSESKQDVINRRNQELEESEDIEGKDPCRNLTYDEIQEKIKEKQPFAIRLLSKGDPEKTFEFEDLIKGKRTIRENNKDIVLLKSNGIPPYSLAHLVDDTLMGTTIVVRGEEWYPSLPAHLELFDACGLPRLRYAHTPVICKNDETGGKRKLSKRKDPEADARYFIEQGYPKIALIEYLINLLNSDFEPWRSANPNTPYTQFNFQISKIGSNNPMFDFNKLNDVSKLIISKMSAKEVYDNILSWAKEFNANFAEFLAKNTEFCLKVFNIDRETPKPRKDIYNWSMVENYYSYMFNRPTTTELDTQDVNNYKEFIATYSKNFTLATNKEDWFNGIKQIAENLGYATDNKIYKSNPEAFKGNTAKACEFIRLALTGRKNSPDLYEIMVILGEKEIKLRLLSQL